MDEKPKKLNVGMRNTRSCLQNESSKQQPRRGLVSPKHERGTVAGAEIDRLCTGWLGDNHGEEMASEYSAYSLVIPMWPPLISMMPWRL
jgi:hypothetical protein